MEFRINDKLILFTILLLNLLLLVQSQIDDLIAIKALSCVNIVTQKYKKGEDEPNAYSPIVLACFIKITDEQAQRVISSLEEGTNPLDQEEIEDLTNVNSLSKFPKEEIDEKVELLENTIREFQKLDDDYGNLKEGKNPEFEDYDDDYEYDDDIYDYNINNNKTLSKKGLIGLFKKGISGIFSVAGSIWYAIFILILIYFILMLFRKTSNENKTNINNNISNENKENEKDNNNENKDNEKKGKDSENKDNVEKQKDINKEKTKID